MSGDREPSCPATRAAALLAGKWKIPILYHLFGGPRRFSDLQRALDGVTQKVLIQHLRQLEADGLISRKVYPQVPPKVEYALTSQGRALKRAMQALCAWSQSCAPRRKPRT